MSTTTAENPKVFIDGEAGTTGLEIRERLKLLDGLDVISIDPEQRKDRDARRDMMAQSDLTVLCLPDDAALEAVSLADELASSRPRILDASTAHRINADWAYGFAELSADQSDAIAAAKNVANPGCYPTGAVALLRPLIDAGMILADHPVTVNAVSGYSGGGRQMIEAYESNMAAAFQLYGLGLEHKHLPELQHYAGLTRRPIFVPSVGNFRQGMLVSIPLHLALLPKTPNLSDIEALLTARYAGSQWVKVIAIASDKNTGKISVEDLNSTDLLELRVFGNDALQQAVLVARLDNLGKGAAGAAVQNIRLMLGL